MSLTKTLEDAIDDLETAKRYAEAAENIVGHGRTWIIHDLPSRAIDKTWRLERGTIEKIGELLKAEAEEIAARHLSSIKVATECGLGDCLECAEDIRTDPADVRPIDLAIEFVEGRNPNGVAELMGASGERRDILDRLKELAVRGPPVSTEKRQRKIVIYETSGEFEIEDSWRLLPSHTADTLTKAGSIARAMAVAADGVSIEYVDEALK